MIERVFAGLFIGAVVAGAQNVAQWAASDRRKWCWWKFARRCVAGGLSGAFAVAGVEI